MKDFFTLAACLAPFALFALANRWKDRPECKPEKPKRFG